MIDYTKIVLQKYAEFDGRARRAEYWYFFLATIVFFFVIGFVLGILSIGADAINFLVILLQIALIVPSIAVGIRRMHDVDKSGWFILVPLYNLYLAVQPGTLGPNRFGPDPKSVVEAVSMPVPVPPVTNPQ